MKNTQKTSQASEELVERCALLEEKNRNLISRIRTLSEENRASESLVRVLLENTPFGIVMFDEKQRIMQINKAAENLLQVERVNIIGKTCNTLFNCYEHNQACPVLHESKILDRVETECRSDMCECDRHLLRSVVKIDNNNETLLVEAFVDISPIKQAQHEIENANQTKDIFLSKVSHELRTPLNAILGFTELLQDSILDIPDKAESVYLNNIIRASKKLLRMVDEVLDITRITAKRLKLDEYQVDTKSLIQQVCNEISDLCDEQLNIINMTCSDEVSIIYTDPYRLHQILFHLLDNACKYTRKGKININVARQIWNDSDWIAFSVKDTGEGMDAEQQARIFAGFEQADVGYTRRHGGAGLGLTLCKDISALMGGEIQMTSEPGTGSEFVLLLPFKESLD